MVGLPFVFAKYTDPKVIDPFGVIPFLPVDSCRCWQTGWQDLGVTARYNLINGAFALTPSVFVGVPTHDYNFRGEAVVGNHLKELRLSLDAGQRLDAISPRLSVQGHYAYAFVERVIGIPNNRSNAELEAGFLITRHLAARGVVYWQRVHGGLRFGGSETSALPFPGDVTTPEQMFEHDRLLRDNNWRVGGGISYSLPRVDLFASYVAFARSTDSHTGRSIAAGISWPFEVTRRPRP